MIGRMLYRVFRRDIGRKLVALSLAVIVWWLLSLYVSDEDSLPLEVRPVATRAEAEQQRFTAPAVFVVVPPGMIVRSLGTQQVRVNVKGLRSQVAGMQLYAILEVPPDALGAEDEIEYAFTLRPGMFRTERGRPQLSEITFEPREVRLLLAQEVRRTFELTPRNVTLTGTPRQGYGVDTYSCRIRPSQVELVGPRGVVDMVFSDPSLLRLQPVDITGQALSVTRQVGLDRQYVDPSLTMLTVGGLVDVTVPITPEDRERQLLSVPVVYENEDQLVTRNLRRVEATATVDLIVEGPPQILDPLSDKDLRRAIRPVFDWSEAGLEQARDRVTFFLSGVSGLTIRDLDGRPPEISYTLERIETVPAAPVEDDGDAP